jgi:hypothetical protein
LPPTVPPAPPIPLAACRRAPNEPAPQPAMSLRLDLLALKYRKQVLHFLKTDPHINKTNFSFQGYKVYPSCYRVDVRNAIDNSDIEVKVKNLSGRVMAQYWNRFLLIDDELTLSIKFNIASPVDQSYLLHECTHAHLDNQKLGKMPRDLNEAICYTAQHVWLMAYLNAHPKGVGVPQGRIHAAAHRIGQQILGGKHPQYAVDQKLAQALRNEIRSDPDYAKEIRKKPMVTSDGV